MRRFFVLVVLLLVPAGAIAQVACGTVVGPREKRMLTADLGPCDGMDAALVVDGGSLDLGDHTITCSDLDGDGEVPRGVVLDGKRSRVQNGTVLGCATGIVLDGDGEHRVTKMTTQRSGGAGVRGFPDTDGSRLVDVTSIENAEDGFDIRSDTNRLVRGIAADNGADGFRLPPSAERNTLVAVRAERNADKGIFLGGSLNMLRAATALQNGTIGIDLAGSANRVVRGTAASNPTYDVANCAGDRVKRLRFDRATDDCRR